MKENQLYEVVANLVLQSVSVWEDMHLYALTYSSEYNTFWGSIDDELKDTVCRYRRQYREERLVPFSMSLIKYYQSILTQESFEKVRGLHWKKQLKFIMADTKFRSVMDSINKELRAGNRTDYRYLARRAPEAGTMRITSCVSTADAVTLLYNHV